MIPYKLAREVAIETGEAIKPFCEVVNIAGSVRRKKSECKDIELLCVPWSTLSSTKDLFGNQISKVIISDNFIKAINTLGSIVKGKPDGRYMQIRLKRGIILDLFMPERLDYYRQYAIRTGSADYVRCSIATRWKKLGWCGTEYGLRRIEDCFMKSNHEWEVVIHDGEKPPVWESEQHFFDWLQLPWIMPPQRKI